MADARAEYGEMNITKLNQRIDSIEVKKDDIFSWSSIKKTTFKKPEISII